MSTDIMRKSKIMPSSAMRWLLAANIIALIFFGGRYWYSAIKERQEQHRLIADAANTVARTGEMNMTDATTLFELSNDLEHGTRISDAQLDWCINQLKEQSPSNLSAASRRLNVTNVLSEAVQSMDDPQKEKLFQAMVSEFKMDNPEDEVGIDVVGPAHILSRLGDKRAIPLLQEHLNDPRPHVHQVVAKAVKTLEGTATR